VPGPGHGSADLSQIQNEILFIVESIVLVISADHVVKPSPQRGSQSHLLTPLVEFLVDSCLKQRKSRYVGVDNLLVLVRRVSGDRGECILIDLVIDSQSKVVIIRLVELLGEEPLTPNRSVLIEDAIFTWIQGLKHLEKAARIGDLAVSVIDIEETLLDLPNYT